MHSSIRTSCRALVAMSCLGGILLLPGRADLDADDQIGKEPAPKHESPVYRLGVGGGLEEVETRRSILGAGIRPDQRVTVIVPVVHLTVSDALNTVSQLPSGNQNLNFDPSQGSTLRFWEVAGRNSLVVSGLAIEVEHALRFLAAIDVPEPEPERIVNLYRIEYADASELAQLLERFVSQPASRSSRPRSPLRTVRARTSDSDRSRTQIVVDSRTNKVVVRTDSEQDLRDIEMLIREFDVREAAGEEAGPRKDEANAPTSR